MKRKVLYVLHGHPVVRPGGAEGYALELYESMRRSDDFEPVLMARIGTAGYTDPPRHPGAPITVIGDDPNQYFVLTEWEPYNEFLESYREKALYTTYIADFLRAYRPDVVHFQHTHFIGYDFVTLVRRMMPQVPIVYTLQEFLAICHRDGQMVRTNGELLCTHASPRRCNECFPEWSSQHFFLRERFIKSHLAHVDQFLAPSRFLLERFVDWGIPREKIRFEEYGRTIQRPFGGNPRAGPARGSGSSGRSASSRAWKWCLPRCGSWPPRRPRFTSPYGAPASRSCPNHSGRCSGTCWRRAGRTSPLQGPTTPVACPGSCRRSTGWSCPRAGGRTPRSSSRRRSCTGGP